MENEYQKTGIPETTQVEMRQGGQAARNYDRLAGDGRTRRPLRVSESESDG
jgi:hypothetical protein